MNILNNSDDLNKKNIEIKIENAMKLYDKIYLWLIRTIYMYYSIIHQNISKIEKIPELSKIKLEESKKLLDKAWNWHKWNIRR